VVFRKEYADGGQGDFAAERVGADDHPREQFAEHGGHFEEALDEVATDFGDNDDDGQLKNQMHHHVGDAVSGGGVASLVNGLNNDGECFGHNRTFRVRSVAPERLLRFARSAERRGVFPDSAVC